MTSPDLEALLACPRCDNRITAAGDSYECAGCKTVFPVLGGVPFLFADPGTALDAWRSRYHARVRETHIGQLDGDDAAWLEQATRAV